MFLNTMVCSILNDPIIFANECVSPFIMHESHVIRCKYKLNGQYYTVKKKSMLFCEEFFGSRLIKQFALACRFHQPSVVDAGKRQ